MSVYTTDSNVVITDVSRYFANHVKYCHFIATVYERAAALRNKVFFARAVNRAAFCTGNPYVTRAGI